MYIVEYQSTIFQLKKSTERSVHKTTAQPGLEILRRVWTHRRFSLVSNVELF